MVTYGTRCTKTVAAAAWRRAVVAASDVIRSVNKARGQMRREGETLSDANDAAKNENGNENKSEM